MSKEGREVYNQTKKVQELELVNAQLKAQINGKPANEAEMVTFYQRRWEEEVTRTKELERSLVALGERNVSERERLQATIQALSKEKSALAHLGGRGGGSDIDHERYRDLQETNKKLMHQLNDLTSRPFFVSADARAASGRRLADLESLVKEKETALSTSENNSDFFFQFYEFFIARLKFASKFSFCVILVVKTKFHVKIISKKNNFSNFVDPG